MQAKKRHIFLADDDSEDREIFAEALAAVAPDVILTEFVDGMHLMDALQSPSVLHPEIIFLDLNMPKKSGLECLAEIREHREQFAGIQIVVFSTSTNPAVIRDACEIGAKLYAIKPSNFNALATLIRKILDHDWNMPVEIDKFVIDCNPDHLRNYNWKDLGENRK